MAVSQDPVLQPASIAEKKAALERTLIQIEELSAKAPLCVLEKMLMLQ